MNREMPHLTLPVVLVHGIFMRDDSRIAWGRIPLWLSEGGNAVFFAGTNACSPVEVNAQILASTIERVCAQRGVEAVHLIGFSRGGIDARYCAEHFGQAGRIASITTLCTPHAGSFVARNGFTVLPNPAIRTVVRAAECWASALGDPHPDAYKVFCDLDPLPDGGQSPPMAQPFFALISVALKSFPRSVLSREKISALFGRPAINEDGQGQLVGVRLHDAENDRTAVFRPLDCKGSRQNGFTRFDSKVYCQSYALESARPCRVSFMKPVETVDVPNDGLVSVRSAAWENYRGSFYPANPVNSARQTSPINAFSFDVKHKDMVDACRRRMRLAIKRPDGTAHDVGDLRDAWCLMLDDLKEAVE